MENKNGFVYLVGAGPGDPGLLTLKGKECIEKADIVVYDYLASSQLLKFAGEDAKIIYVGKKGGDHTLPQDKINDLIVEKAKEGYVVTRLKGGDPFIFGRGGEEAEELKEAGIGFEIVPGVTSAIAAPAYAGIPLTHRSHTSSATLITGHEDPTKSDSSLDWANIAQNNGTLVFLMGVKNLPNIAGNLMKHGKAPSTPVALVRWGTTTRQQTVTGTLETIVEEVEKAGLKSPSIIIVGNVVGLRDTLSWFEKRPLFGKKIIITRARHQSSDLFKLLSDLGADCLECPTIDVKPVAEDGPLKASINDLHSYKWIVFTSVNGVRFFFKKLFSLGHDVRALSHIKTACIGPSTAAELKRFGLSSDIIPKSYRAESVIDAFQNEEMDGVKVLLPRASEARPVIPVELTKMGAEVNEVHTYHTVLAEGSREALREVLEEGEVDAVTFTSSSTVKNFLEMLPESGKTLLDNVCIASIGPVTSETAESLGLKVDISAETYTIPGLVETLLNHFKA